MKKYCDRCEYGVGHKCKQLKYEGNEVCIDEGMSEFIELLWANDIKTEGCCEGGNQTQKGSAYVTFPSMLDYEKFLYLIHKILYEKHDGNPNYAGTRDLILEAHNCRVAEAFPYVKTSNHNPIEPEGWDLYPFVRRIDATESYPQEFLMSSSTNNLDKYGVSWIVSFPFLDVNRMIKLLKGIKNKRTVIIQKFPNISKEQPYGAISITGSSIVGFGAYQTRVLSDKSDSYTNYITSHVISGDLDPLMLVTPCLINLQKPERFHEAGEIEVLVDDECPSDEELEALTYKYDKPLEEFFTNNL